MTDLAISRGIPLSEEPGLGALTLPGFLRELKDRHAQQEALVMHHTPEQVERWTYADLWDRSVDVARSLIACGVGKDSRVGILMTNRLEWVSSCFGISLAGGTAVGLSTFSTPAELEYLIRESGVSMILFEREVLTKDFAAILQDLEPAIASAEPGQLSSMRFPYLRRLVALGDGPVGGAMQTWQDFMAMGAVVDPELIHEREKTTRPSDAALLLFSSGSTGKPKGILNSHRGVCIQCWRYARIYGFEKGESPVRLFSANGFFWSGNFAIGLGGGLAAGGAIILQPTFVPEESLRLMQAERVTMPFCAPHQWARLEALPEWDDADLSSFYYFDVDRNLRRPQKSITYGWIESRASYGSTETFTISTAYGVGVPQELWEGNNGPPLPGNTIKIVDPETGEILQRGESGELAVKGPTLMLGYIGVSRDEALDDEGYYRSGDGGFIDEQGRFVFQGRINDIIKTGGANVSPVEVDYALGTCPGVKVCKTTGVPHETLGEMVVSLVAPEPGSGLTGDDVVAYLKERLASYKVPRKVLFVSEDDLNMTGTSKIKPNEARELAARKMASEAAAAG